jgi:hypothetical protein
MYKWNFSILSKSVPSGASKLKYFDNCCGDKAFLVTASIIKFSSSSGLLCRKRHSLLSPYRHFLPARFGFSNTFEATPF